MWWKLVETSSIAHSKEREKHRLSVLNDNLSALEAISDRLGSRWTSLVRPSANVTFPLLGSRKFHQGVDGLPFVRVGFD